MTLNRRDFLRTISLASGAVFLGASTGCNTSGNESVRLVKSASQRYSVAHAFLRDSNRKLTPTRQTSVSVCIVGAGFAGLTAAWQLQKQGIDCTVVESEAMAGGCARAKVTDSKSHSLPLGNVYFVERLPVIDEMAQNLGVNIISCPDDVHLIGANSYNDIWSDDQINSAARSTTDAEGMKRFRDDLMAIPDDDLPSYPLPDATHPHIQKFDSISAEEYVRKYNSPTLNAVLDAYTRSSMGSGLSGVNAYCLLNFYSDEFGLSHSMQRWLFEGGTANFLSQLASRNNNVDADQLAYSLEQTSIGWTVHTVDAEGRGQAIHAKAVILATPGYVTRILLQRASDSFGTVVPRLRYAPYATFHVKSSVPLIPAGTYDTWHLPATELYTDLITPDIRSTAPKHDEHWSSVFSPLRESERASMMNDAALAAYANRVADAVIGRLQVDPSALTEIYAWVWGHGLVIPSVGSHAAMAGFSNRLPNTVALANTDTAAAASIENAVNAGIRAVERIVGSI